MGSPIPETRPLKAPQGVHLVLSVGFPALSFALDQWWATGQWPSWPAGLLALVYTLVMAVWAPWRLRSRQGPLLKFWLWLVATLGLWAALALVEALPWPRTFAFEGLHGLWFLVAFAQGQLAMLWAGQLTSRARLFQLIEGFPEGRVLEDRVRDFQLDADFSRGNQATLSTSVAVMGALAVLLVAVTPARPQGLSTFFLGGYLTLCLLIGVLLRTYRREMEALMYGHRFDLTAKLAPLGWSLLLAILSASGASALLSLGGPWFDFSGLLPQPAILPNPPPEPPPLPEPPLAIDGDYRLAVLLALLARIFEVRHIGMLVSLVCSAVIWLAPWVAAAFVVWPLLRWFLSGGRQTRGLLRRWRRLLVAQILGFFRALDLWWRGPVSSPAPRTATGAREWLRSFFTGTARGRRRPYPEVVEAFLTLARWAEPLTVYHKGETTREFLDRLAALVPDRGEDLRRVRDLLDRELFGLNGLDSAERKAFLALIAQLVATPSHGPPPEVS